MTTNQHLFSNKKLKTKRLTANNYFNHTDKINCKASIDDTDFSSDDENYALESMMHHTDAGKKYQRTETYLKKLDLDTKKNGIDDFEQSLKLLQNLPQINNNEKQQNVPFVPQSMITGSFLDLQTRINELENKTNLRL